MPALTGLPLQVPCVAVVENMSYFEVDGVKHFPFGKGSGDRIVKDYGLSNLVRFPIVAELSAAGDGESFPRSTRFLLDFPLQVSFSPGFVCRFDISVPVTMQ